MVLETLIKADDLLDHLNRENEHESRKITQANPRLDDLCKKYEEWVQSSQCECEAPTIIGDSKFTAKEIQEFLIQRNKLEANAGYFISALINSSSDKDFILRAEHLESQLNYLGFNNRKNIVFYGDAGNFIGKGMKSGLIEIMGNVRDFLGNCMDAGAIIVHGNVGNYSGYSMYGGRIKIYQNAKFYVGEEMRGGEILLYGKYKYISLGEKIHSGHIYQKRRLFPGWRKLR